MSFTGASYESVLLQSDTNNNGSSTTPLLSSSEMSSGALFEKIFPNHVATVSSSDDDSCSVERTADDDERNIKLLHMRSPTVPRFSHDNDDLTKSASSVSLPVLHSMRKPKTTLPPSSLDEGPMMGIDGFNKGPAPVKSVTRIMPIQYSAGGRVSQWGSNNYSSFYGRSAAGGAPTAFPPTRIKGKKTVEQIIGKNMGQKSPPRSYATVTRGAANNDPKQQSNYGHGNRPMGDGGRVFDRRPNVFNRSRSFYNSYSNGIRSASNANNCAVQCSFAETSAVVKMKHDPLSIEIYELFLASRQTSEMFVSKVEVRDRVWRSLSRFYPSCGLYIVGSSMNGFGTRRSDCDATMMISHGQIGQRFDAFSILRDVSRILAQEASWVEDQQLIPAKVPILRIQFHYPYDKVHMDLNVDNAVTIRNTHLLLFYSSFDYRVRPLVLMVKEWARVQGINNASRSTLTSYSLSLMLIHFLQCGATPAVLPCLHKSYPDKFSQERDTRSLNIIESLPTPEKFFTKRNEQPVGDLFLRFLHYYAYDFDFDRSVVSIRTGVVLRKETVVSGSEYPNQWRCICIEEPYTQSNTAHSVYDDVVFSGIKQVFAESYRVLSVTRRLDSILRNGSFSNLPAMTTTTDKDGSSAEDRIRRQRPKQQQPMNGGGGFHRVL